MHIKTHNKKAIPLEQLLKHFLIILIQSYWQYGLDPSLFGIGRCFVKHSETNQAIAQKINELLPSLK